MATINGFKIPAFENIGGRMEEKYRYISLGEVPDCPSRWEDLQKETVWYYPYYDILIIKNYEQLYMELDDGTIHFVELPGPGLIPAKLEYIGTL
jgi:hypothetical protein